MATTLINPFVFAGEELGGMVLITPTSIASTGTGNSSSIGANGSVEFSSCATLSLNGVFSATYDNYMISMRSSRSANSEAVYLRMRVGGVDESSASNYYTHQRLLATSTTVAGARTTTNLARIGDNSSTARNGHSLNLYGPYLAQPTAGRSVVVSGESSGVLDNYAFTHSLSTSYDGFTVYVTTDTFSGLISVYGLVGA